MSLWRFWKRVAAERAQQKAEPKAERQDLQRDQRRRAKTREIFERLEPLLDEIKSSDYHIAVTDEIEVSGTKGREICIRPVFEDEAAELSCDGTDFCNASREMQELGCVFHIDARDSYEHHLPRPSGLCESGELAQFLVETLIDEIANRRHLRQEKWREKRVVWRVMTYLLLVFIGVLMMPFGGLVVGMYLLLVAFSLLWAVRRS